jgi:hypothetical protein
LSRPPHTRLLLVAALLLPGAPARAQVRVESAVLYESYSFGNAFTIGGSPGISGVSQLSVPFTLALPLGGRASLTASGGYVRTELTASDTSEPIEPVTGLTDAELRLQVALVPGRLLFIATGAAPTGQASVDARQTGVLTVLVRDVLGFSTRTLGSGGNYGAGLAAAVPAGSMAFGFAGAYTRFGTYEPVAGTDRRLQPAGEIRLRAGLEGPVGSSGYVRAAGIFSRRGRDEINGEAVVDPSSRVASYLSYDGRVGGGGFLAYAYDLYRAGASLEGPALLPKANLFAAGLQLTLAIRRDTRLQPRVELRRTDQATDGSDTLERLGTSFRFGADLRQRLGDRATLVLEGNGLRGTVASEIEAGSRDVDVSGYRFGVHLEIAR